MYDKIQYDISDDNFLKKLENINLPSNKVCLFQNYCNLVNETVINIKKRKRESNDDIIKIRCYHCNTDITKLFNNGTIYLHKCPKILMN
jgi:hypothetical protein